jgi:hypothetical protein
MMTSLTSFAFLLCVSAVHVLTECKNEFCASPIEKRQWTHNQGLLIRFGGDMHCHPLHTPATPTTPSRIYQRHPVDRHTCVCSSEQCQQGVSAHGQPPRCVDLSSHPHLARQTNSGLCTCADGHCQLAPPGTLYKDDDELAKGPQCVALKQHPEFARAEDGKCGTQIELQSACQFSHSCHFKRPTMMYLYYSQRVLMASAANRANTTPSV